MHPGFALVETGLCRAKNSVNILAKNFITVAIGLLTFAVLGFNLMYPGDNWILGHFLGFGGFGVNAPEGSAAAIGYNGGLYGYWTDFIFQGMFAATSVTIVSGAVAERINICGYLRGIRIHANRFLGMGRRMAQRARLLRLGRFDICTLCRRLGRSGWSIFAWTAHRQVCKRQDPCNSRKQSRVRNFGRVSAVVRMVRI